MFSYSRRSHNDIEAKKETKTKSLALKIANKISVHDGLLLSIDWRLG